MKLHAPISTSDIRSFNRAWKRLGGSICNKNATGELLYGHPNLNHPLTINGRRKDTPKKLCSTFNQIWANSMAANDPVY